MTIKFISGSVDAERIFVDYTELTLKSLQGELESRDLNFSVDSSTIINYSYKNSAGRQMGELTETTILNLEPTTVIMITQQPRETKARAYSAEELVEVIAAAKAALVSQVYKDLRTACRELSQVSPEVKELIGNYTHYSVADLVDAVEEVVEFLSPEVVEVGTGDIQAIISRIEAIEAKIQKDFGVDTKVLAQFATELSEIKADVDFINQHFDLK